MQVRSRIKGAGSTRGFVVGVSDSLILIHEVNGDTFSLNGYSVVRCEDVKDYRVFDKREYWQNRAIRRLKIAPVALPEISLASVPALLASIDERFSLTAFHPEQKRPDICYIGRLLTMTDKTVTIDDLDSNAEWSGPRRIKLNDITRIDFGSAYEEALAVVAPKRPRRKTKRPNRLSGTVSADGRG